jgi:hypothetical protein
LSTIIEPLPPIFAEVHDRVAEDWTTERGEELNEQFYANLRDSYTIVIEEPSVMEEESADEVALVPEQSR